MATSTKSITVLLIDDDEDDYLIIRRLFSRIPRSEFMLEWVQTYEAGERAIQAGTHDIYLVDYRLGAKNGLELLRTIDLGQRVQPFIILTGAGDERIEQEAMKLGVADYLVKGHFDIQLLSRVLHYSLQRKRMEAQRLQHLIEINASKDEFIALASHQLRTPATAVKQYVGMLIEGYAGDMNDMQLSFLTSAYSSNERQLKVVDDILRVAQLDLKKVRLKAELIDVHTFLENIISEFKPQFDTRQQGLQYEQSSPTLEMYGDPMYLHMALSNVIDNAGKYTHEGKKITVRVSEERERFVTIAVSDEGLGIDRGDFAKLFVKFSRIPNELSVKVGGTGLGLYWAHEIMKLHHGRISVVSTVGKGTTFTLWVPVNSRPEV